MKKLFDIKPTVHGEACPACGKVSPSNATVVRLGTPCQECNQILLFVIEENRTKYHIAQTIKKEKSL